MISKRQLLAAILPTLFFASASFAELVPPPQLEPVGPPLFPVKVNGKAGYMNPSGKIVIEPVFDSALPFTEGLARVGKQGKWGFIDTTGRVVIEPQFVSVDPFSDGLAGFESKEFSKPHGYIDKTGKVVIKPQFDVVEPFRNGIARVGFGTLKGRLLSLVADVGVECEYKFIDRTGKFVPEPSPAHYATGKRGELIPFRKGDKAGYVNAKGEVVIEPQFGFASPFSDGIALVNTKDGVFGYIDTRGKWVISPRFRYATDFSEGLAGVSFGEKGWGVIDRAGNVVIPPKFSWVYGSFRHGVVEVVQDRKAGYINRKGEWVWAPR